jgi:hypothetical protein
MSAQERAQERNGSGLECAFCHKDASDQYVCVMPCKHLCHRKCLLDLNMTQDPTLQTLLTKLSPPGPLDYEKIVRFWNHINGISTWRRITGAPQSDVENTVKRWTRQIVSCNLCPMEVHGMPKGCQTLILLEQLVIRQIETQKTDLLESDLKRWKALTWESTWTRSNAIKVLTDVHDLVKAVQSVEVDAYQWPSRDLA